MARKRGMTVLDPTGKASAIQEVAPASRLEELQGKSLGILWNEKPNGDILLSRIEEHLTRRFDISKVVWKRKSSGGRAPVQVLEDLARECDVVINGIGD